MAADDCVGFKQFVIALEWTVMQQRIIYDRGRHFNNVLQFALCHLLI